VLTVGTDCALGKKYTALALAENLGKRGVAATFRATGQTGIMISGEGIAIDAVVADFIAGAAEQLSPDNAADHWDVIEGQGSLFHPAYAAVTLGLLHGSQPDAIVLCHDPARRTIDEYPDFPIPDLRCRHRRLSARRPADQCRHPLRGPEHQFVEPVRSRLRRLLRAPAGRIGIARMRSPAHRCRRTRGRPARPPGMTRCG
jgi:hypothetical protein